MPLNTLDEHNAEQTEAYEEAKQLRNAPHLTGIQCPNCEGELVNPTPQELIGPEPHLINVACQTPDCDYTGTAKAFV